MFLASILAILYLFFEYPNHSNNHPKVSLCYANVILFLMLFFFLIEAMKLQSSKEPLKSTMAEVAALAEVEEGVGLGGVGVGYY